MPVTLVSPYDTQWPAAFGQLRSFYACHLGRLALSIEHVGSTSVPGMTAKPIIDVDIVIAPGTFEQVRRALEAAGFEHEGNLGIPMRDAFKPVDQAVAERLPNHHPYVCPTDSPELRRHLRFRDFLRSHPEHVSALSDLKWSLCEEHDNDRQAYMDGKAPFCSEISRLALLESPDRDHTGGVGLRRGTVSLSEYAEDWPRLYREEADVLRWHAGDLFDEIQHAGSTSVPGLVAKPILDIVARIESRAVLDRLVASLEKAGYIYRGDKGEEGGILFVRDIAPEVRVVHLHVVAGDDPQWYHYVGFRDALRGDVKLCEEYATLKRDLASRFASDRESYTAAKHRFIRDTLARLS